jgi:hypothetical protein
VTGTGSDSEFDPTAGQRVLVENAAAFGVSQVDIANPDGCCEILHRPPHGLERDKR